MGKRKYLTEEERKEARREYMRQYRQTHGKELAENNKRYYQEHKEEYALKHKQYHQKHREEICERVKQWNKEHKEERAEYQKQWKEENKDKLTKYHRQHRQTPIGRANYLLQSYKKADKDKGRGECTIPNAQWIVENIFTQKCHWCPETDWREMGCDRINNSLPHTPDNVIPCCERCNKDRGRKTYDEFKKSLRAEEIVL